MALPTTGLTDSFGWTWVSPIPQGNTLNSVYALGGGPDLTIAGNHVTIDDESLVLTDTEAGVLTMLAWEPNHVYAKADLLRQVWRDEGADPHVVEAVVNRLRRRLGPSGRSISAVYRRGYTLRV